MANKDEGELKSIRMSAMRYQILTSILGFVSGDSETLTLVCDSTGIKPEDVEAACDAL